MTKNWQRRLTINLIVGFTFFLLGIVASNYSQYLHYKKIAGFELMKYTWNLISSEYYNKKLVNPQEMMYGAIKGMVNSLKDPFTIFLTPEEHKAFQESLNSEFTGTGIQVSKNLIIMSVLNNAPAQSKDIKVGDQLVKINDLNASSLGFEEVNLLLNGKEGSALGVELYRAQENKYLKYQIVSGKFISNTIEYKKVEIPQKGQIDILKVTRFGKQTLNEWKRWEEQVLIDKTNGIILDLRDNLGGYLDTPVYIFSEFTTNQVMGWQENRQGLRKAITVDHIGRLQDIPLIILVNKKTMSATELLAGSLQYYKRAALIGEQSYGKGLMQDIYDLEGGTGLHITTNKWFLPNNSSINNIGLTPDIKVTSSSKYDLEAGRDIQLNRALEKIKQISTSY